MRRLRSILPVLFAGIVPLACVAPASAAEHDPVIFIHGWHGGNFNWFEMADDFAEAGYAEDDLVIMNYDSSQSNATTAAELSTLVDETLENTGAEKVDIVTHSMGALSARWYLNFGNGIDRVDDLAMIAGPNHGTESANGCEDDACMDMRPGSEMLTELNSGDTTPGETRYGTWWSDCDEIIQPPESSQVEGAENHKTPNCLFHLTILGDDDVSQQIREFLA